MTVKSSLTHQEKWHLPVLVTLAFEKDAFEYFDNLRKQYFPPERNFLPAHITLFHHLPGAELERVKEVLRSEASVSKPFILESSGLWMLGKGVAYTLESPEAVALRSRLAAAFEPWLAPQDRTQKFKPHITVQNKTTPEAAKALYDQLSKDFIPMQFQATRLDLWYYVGGPWEFIGHYDF